MREELFALAKEIDRLEAANASLLAQLEKFPGGQCPSCGYPREDPIEGYVGMKARAEAAEAALSAERERGRAMREAVEAIAFIGTSGTGYSAEGKLAYDFLKANPSPQDDKPLGPNAPSGSIPSSPGRDRSVGPLVSAEAVKPCGIEWESVVPPKGRWFCAREKGHPPSCRPAKAEDICPTYPHSHDTDCPIPTKAEHGVPSVNQVKAAPRWSDKLRFTEDAKAAPTKADRDECANCEPGAHVHDVLCRWHGTPHSGGGKEEGK